MIEKMWRTSAQRAAIWKSLGIPDPMVGVDTDTLVNRFYQIVAKYGTPLYVMSESEIRSRMPPMAK